MMFSLSEILVKQHNISPLNTVIKVIIDIDFYHVRPCFTGIKFISLIKLLTL